MKGGLEHSLSGVELNPGCAFSLGSARSVSWLHLYFRKKKKQPSKPATFAFLTLLPFPSASSQLHILTQSAPCASPTRPGSHGPRSALCAYVQPGGGGWREGGRMVETGSLTRPLVFKLSHLLQPCDAERTALGLLFKNPSTKGCAVMQPYCFLLQMWKLRPGELKAGTVNAYTDLMMCQPAFQVLSTDLTHESI